MPPSRQAAAAASRLLKVDAKNTADIGTAAAVSEPGGVYIARRPSRNYFFPESRPGPNPVFTTGTR